MRIIIVLHKNLKALLFSRLDVNSLNFALNVLYIFIFPTNSNQDNWRSKFHKNLCNVKRNIIDPYGIKGFSRTAVF